MTSLTVLDTKVSSALKNMLIDTHLLHQLEVRLSPLLHLYAWDRPSITYGFFLDPFAFLDQEQVIKQNLCLAKRPTGGGIVVHLWDYAFSLLVPKCHPAFSCHALENYAFVNEAVKKAFIKAFSLDHLHLKDKLVESPQKKPTFCMAVPTKYDVMYQGKKIAGAAQRMTKHGFLHQGTISLVKPDFSLIRQCLKDPSIADAMQNKGFYLECQDLESLRQKIKQCLIVSLEEMFGCL